MLNKKLTILKSDNFEIFLTKDIRSKGCSKFEAFFAWIKFH